jgi:hypothetical protein
MTKIFAQSSIYRIFFMEKERGEYVFAQIVYFSLFSPQFCYVKNMKRKFVSILRVTINSCKTFYASSFSKYNLKSYCTTPRIYQL